MRHLRAVTAALLLVLLIVGFPLALASTIGNPLQGWDALRAGDVSDDVVLDVLAAIAWAAWACFAWAVLGELLTLAAATPRPHLPGTLPGPQHLAHTLVTAAFLVLPSTAPLLHTSPTTHTSTLHTDPRPQTPAPAPGTTGPTPDPTQPTPSSPPTQHHGAGNLKAIPTAAGPRAGPAHRAGGGLETTLSSAQFGLGAGIGLSAGITLRELGHLRRRQWRYRRPGRAIPTTPPDLAHLEKALIRGSTSISDTDRALILAAYANTQDQPMPPARGQAPWDTFADAAGAPLPQFTLTHETPPPTRTTPTAPSTPSTTTDAAPNPTTERHREPDPDPDRQDDENTGALTTDSDEFRSGLSMLIQPLDAGPTTTASTARDIEALAPRVPDRLHRSVQHADPGLDDDLAAWHALHVARPRLSLLGPIRVRATGDLPEPRPRLAWHTEVVTYLAAHPRGVTPEKFGTDLWPDDPAIAGKPKSRQAIFVVRRWLGADPTTGKDYLPPGKTPEGTSLYRLDDILTDAELFRRLRLRGVTRGPKGSHDLETALSLVTGPPLDPSHRRAGGYTWLIDTPLDIEYTAMIIDVAHLVATHHLRTGRPDLAAHAAQISLTAGSQDDIPLLDLVAASDAQGHHAEATRWIQQILTTHDTTIEEDLPPRTAELLHRRRWHQAS